MNVYVRELAQAMARHGIHVDIFTREHDPKDKQTYHLEGGARLIHLRAGEDGDMHKLALYSFIPEFASNLESYQKRYSQPYHLVFSHYWLSGWAGKSLTAVWQVPHMVMFHTLGAVKNAIGIGEEASELRVETERLLIGDCNRIIASTQREKTDLMDYYQGSPQRIAVIPCGVNLERFRPLGREGARRRLGLGNQRLVLFIGRIEPLKGIDQLIRSMSYLKQSHQPQLMIIGGDEHSRHEITRLQQLAREFDVADTVTFAGLVRHEELPYFYSAADVLAIPSYHESFGLVALEAMACGTPVVATDVGNLRDIIRDRDSGYVVADNAPHTLADKIAAVLSHSEMRSPQEIRAAVASYGWENIARQVTEQCQQLLVDYPALVS